MMIDDEPEAQTLIRIQNISKRFGDLQAVDDLSLSVAKGEIVGFLGPNGAGKSTTMKMLAGTLNPDAGAISICGHDVAAAPTEAQTFLGYLPEGAPAYGEMTPRRFLQFIADVRGFKGEDAERAIQNAAARAQVKGVLDQRIETLSKGFRRRVGLAQAILHDPPVLVLDEPTDGLDPNQKFAVRRLITSMAENKAILISTHILEEVEPLCDRVVIIDRGKLAAEGAPQDLLARSRYRHAVTVETDKDKAGPMRDALEPLKAQAEVREQTHDWGVQFLLLPKTETRILEAVIGKASPLNPRGIFCEPGRLDDIFRDLTSSDVAPDKDKAA